MFETGVKYFFNYTDKCLCKRIVRILEFPERMASELVYIPENDVQSLLDWDALFPALEQALADVSSKCSLGESLIIQPARGIMQIRHKNAALLTMPGMTERRGVLACKIVTSFVDNPKRHNLPSILANIILLDSDTGSLKAIVAGTTITQWRTACASAVATKYLCPDTTRRVLAVLGAGKQGRIHIIAFQHFFKFEKVRLWNRTRENAVKLVNELRENFNIGVEIFQTPKECAEDADVIVTATYSSDPLLSYNDVKPEAVINAVGAGIKHHCELDRSIYEKSTIYVDSMANAETELKGLRDEGYNLIGEIGEIINGTKQVQTQGLLVFHSLGMAVEDAVAADLVWTAFCNRDNNKKATN